MKTLIFRGLMLIGVIVGLVAGYFWLMQRHAVQDKPPVELIREQLLEGEQDQVVLAGRLIFEDGVFYIERDDKSKVPVFSSQVDLYMFRDREVTVGAKFIEDRLDVFRVEER